MAFSVSYIYEVLDRYTAPLKRINKATDGFTRRMGKVRGGLKNMNARFASMQGAAASAAAALGGATMVNTFNNFETSMNKLAAVTLAGKGEMEAMRRTAKRLGKTTQFTASQSADAMVFLAQAGLDTNKILNAIPGTLQLAAAGGIELSQAADIATNVLAQMGFQVSELGRVNDVLSLAQARTNTNVLELFEAMRPTAVTAKNLGMSLETLTASLGVMANAGEKGSIAGTLLRNALTEMAGPSAKQVKIYKALGINLRKYVSETGKITNFSGFIGKLNELNSTGKLTVPILQALFGERGFRAVQILAGAGADEINRLDKAFQGAGGTAERMAKIQMKGLPGVLKMIQSAWESVQIALFESGFADLLVDLGNKFGEVLRRVASTNPNLLKMIAIIGSLAIVAGPLLVAFGMLSGVLSALFSPIGAVIAAVAGLITIGIALYNSNKNIADSFGHMWQTIKGIFGIFKPLVSLWGLFFKATGGTSSRLDVISAGVKTLSLLLRGLTFPLRTVAKLFDSLINNGVFKTAMGGLSKLKAFFAGDDKAARIPKPKRYKIISTSKRLEAARTEAFSRASTYPPGSLTSQRNAMAASLNGTINVKAEQGTAVTGGTVNTSVPGNVGMNIWGPNESF